MKAKALVSCLIGSSWVLACGSEPPPDEPPETSMPEDEVVVIATAEAVTSAASAATGGAGGSAAAGSASANTSGESSEGSSAATTTASAAATNSTSDGAATDASATGDPGAGGAAGASSGGAAAGGAAGTAADTASPAAGTGASSGSGASGGGGQSSTTGEPLPPPPVPPGALFITEYVEGGDDKAIELSNLSDETVSLAECRLETYFNGNVESSSGVDLTIELRPQNSYVLCKSSASAALFSMCDQTAASINFNGDDALVLRCNGVVHDSFGQVGFDPGDEWRSSEGSDAAKGDLTAYGTADYVLRRRCDAQPRTDPAEPFEAALSDSWVAVWHFDEDAASARFDGLGLAACAELNDTTSGDGAGGAANE